MQKKSEAEKAYWKEEEKRMLGILRSFRAAYTHDCFQEKRPDACYNLADVWSGQDGDYKKAHDMYEKMCKEHKHGHSCFKWGAMKRTGAHGVGQDENAAIEALGLACRESTNPTACYEHALALTMGSDDKYAPDEVAAFDSFKKACAFGHGKSCVIVAKSFLKGINGAPTQDKALALEFAREACRHLRWDGCELAWKMYENGDGVDKNTDMARRYRILTKGLKEQLGIP